MKEHNTQPMEDIKDELTYTTAELKDAFGKAIKRMAIEDSASKHTNNNKAINITRSIVEEAIQEAYILGKETSGNRRSTKHPSHQDRIRLETIVNNLLITPQNNTK
mgnify:FL=1